MRIPKPEVWAIKYEDADVADDVFVGEGAEEAARLTYEKRLSSWNCYLLGPAERIAKLETQLAAMELEQKDEQIQKLREALENARETVHGIAASDWRKWEELADIHEFERWAKSRCAHETLKIDAALKAGE